MTTFLKIERSRQGLRSLRQLLRSKGWSKQGSGWALASVHGGGDVFEFTINGSTLGVELVKVSLEQVAYHAIKIYQDHDYAAEMDAGFDAGEFSGPAHADIAERKVKSLAEFHGYTLEQVWGEINHITNADEGPHGRNV